MTIALNAKNKLKIITKAYPEPDEDSPLRALWERNNDMIISWILNTVSDQISNNLSFVHSASALWLELQDHYSQLDGHRIYQLSNEIAQLKQSNCSVEVFYQKLKGFWDEMDALEAPYTCTCNCTCENGRLNGARESRKRLIQFLMGLDESFANLRGQILLLQPLPNATKAYGMLRQEEQQRETTTPKYMTPAALSTYAHNNHSSQSYQRQHRNTNNNVNQRNEHNARRAPFRQGVICGNCQKEGHYKSECYQLVGYPVGHPLHGKVRPLNKAADTRSRTVNMAIGSDGASTRGKAVRMQQCMLRWTVCRIS